jgi:hypothetical protein
MNEQPRDAVANPGEAEDQVLADARRALADARDALHDEREA